MMLSSAAVAADYAAVPYYPPVRHHAPRVMYYTPPPTIPQAPPVYWVQAPPNYVQHLVPGRGCGGCVGYAAVGRWEQTPPPGPFDRIFDYGY